jgi:hypothetical protein
MFWGLQALGVLADEQIVIMNNMFNNLLVYIIILGIPFIFIHYRKYFLVWMYAIWSIFMGIGALYYNYILLIERWFSAFGMIIPWISIIWGGLSMIVLLYLHRVNILPT